jgi:hypothetical protein
MRKGHREVSIQGDFTMILEIFNVEWQGFSATCNASSTGDEAESD